MAWVGPIPSNVGWAVGRQCSKLTPLYSPVAPPPQPHHPRPSMKRLFKPMLLTLTLAAFAAGPVLAQQGEKKNAWTLSFPETKARFVRVQMEWAKKNPHWNPTKEELEARFDELDVDRDGKLTEEEWANRDAPKKPKRDAKKK